MTPQPRAPYPLLGLFAVLATAIAALAWHVHVTQRQAVSAEVQKQVAAIADSKVKQIDEWRQTRLGQARIILSNRLLLPAVERVIDGRSPPPESAIVGQWLEALCRELRYAGAT